MSTVHRPGLGLSCPLLVFCVLVLLSLPARSDMPSIGFREHWSRAGHYHEDAYGYSVVRLRDLNGDGYREIAVGNPEQRGSGNPLLGKVDILSGRDGSVLYRWDMSDATQPEHVAMTLSDSGDFDGDGEEDVVARRDEFAPSVRDARTGRLISRMQEEIRRVAWVRYMGDLTGDGKSEILVIRDGTKETPGSWYAVYQGKDREEDPWVLVQPEWFGSSALEWTLLEDLDGDGWRDIAVGRWILGSNWPSSGLVDVHSMRTGERISRASIGNGIDQAGICLRSIEDLNGDGFRDLLVGKPGNAPYGVAGAGRIDAVNPLTGAILWVRNGDRADAWNPEIFHGGSMLGLDFDTVGDLDQDGISEILAYTVPETQTLHLRLLSGRTGTVLLDHKASQHSWGFFTTFFPIDDLDGDGRHEVFIATPEVSMYRPDHLDDELGYQGMVFAVSIDLPMRPFLRGDADADGDVDLTDGLRTIQYLWAPTGSNCPAAFDVDADGGVTISDGIRILRYLFDGAPPPSAPFPACGLAPAEYASLSCARDDCGD